jgi:hypothetical protein
MAGHNQLKQSFANETYEMAWHRWRKPLMRYRAEAVMRKILRKE